MRVPLPSRWLRGFLEVQTIQSELAPAAEVDAAVADDLFPQVTGAIEVFHRHQLEAIGRVVERQQVLDADGAGAAYAQ